MRSTTKNPECEQRPSCVEYLLEPDWRERSLCESCRDYMTIRVEDGAVRAGGGLMTVARTRQVAGILRQVAEKLPDSGTLLDLARKYESAADDAERHQEPRLRLLLSAGPDSAGGCRI